MRRALRGSAAWLRMFPRAEGWARSRSGADAVRGKMRRRCCPRSAVREAACLLVGARWTFVQYQPVHAQLPRGFSKLSEVHRFADVAIDAQPVTAHDITLFIGGSKNHHGKHARLFTFADAPQYFESINFRQFEIEEDDLGRILQSAFAFAEQQVDGFFSIACNADVVRDIRFAESADSQQFVVGVVFDKQNDAGILS